MTEKYARPRVYVARYWRPLTGVLFISLISTSISLWLPYLTKLLVDDALVARNAQALRQVVVLFLLSGAIGFVLNVVSGLAYTRVSAAILFDMRRDLYEAGTFQYMKTITLDGDVTSDLFVVPSSTTPKSTS